VWAPGPKFEKVIATMAQEECVQLAFRMAAPLETDTLGIGGGGHV
jgi:hypothetical protein